MAGMDKDVVIAEEMDGEFLVGEMDIAGVRAKAENSIPASVGVEERGGGRRGEKGMELSAIFADAFKQLRAK